jgi:hypothetical protein
MSAEMKPDEQVFRAHLEMGPFLSGVDRGRWRLLNIAWPYVVIAVTAAVRPQGPKEYAFRFELSNYPQAPPTAQPWNEMNNSPLEHPKWPAGRSRIPKAFNPGWQSGQCLYLPCDRIAIVGHDGWRTQHPSMIWQSDGDITQYLRIIYDLLNSSDYTGPRSS